MAAATCASSSNRAAAWRSSAPAANPAPPATTRVASARSMVRTSGSSRATVSGSGATHPVVAHPPIGAGSGSTRGHGPAGASESGEASKVTTAGPATSTGTSTRSSRRATVARTITPPSVPSPAGSPAPGASCRWQLASMAPATSGRPRSGGQPWGQVSPVGGGRQHQQRDGPDHLGQSGGEPGRLETRSRLGPEGAAGTPEAAGPVLGCRTHHDGRPARLRQRPPRRRPGAAPPGPPGSPPRHPPHRAADSRRSPMPCRSQRHRHPVALDDRGMGSSGGDAVPDAEDRCRTVPERPPQLVLGLLVDGADHPVRGAHVLRAGRVVLEDEQRPVAPVPSARGHPWGPGPRSDGCPWHGPSRSTSRGRG